MNGQDLTNEGTEIYHEYLTRLRLAKLGYRSNFADLDPFKADCFLIIDTEIDKVRAKKQGKKNGK